MAIFEEIYSMPIFQADPGILVALSTLKNGATKNVIFNANGHFWEMQKEHQLLHPPCKQKF